MINKMSRTVLAGRDAGVAELVDFKGIYPMLYAFFDGAGRLDRAAMCAQVEYCIASGAHGVAALGLGTEVSKLSPLERRQVMQWAAEDLRGRLPLAITVFGATPEEQIAFVQAAAERGADWVILQPPQPSGGQAAAPLSEDRLVDFFGAVADAAALPVAIQNAPQYIGVGLSEAGIDRLTRDHPNVQLLKAEGSAVETASLIELSGARLAVFQGRGGLEFIDVMRAGCVGLIPSVESCHVQARMFELLQRGRGEDEAEAERLYGQLAPLIVFLMQSIDQFLCYGKRLTARRLGLGEVHDRQPAQPPTAFGLACLERYAAVLDRLP
jgi:4-hydroxy-tetrahydrodipicolinate synthase